MRDLPRRLPVRKRPEVRHCGVSAKAQMRGQDNAEAWNAACREGLRPSLQPASGYFIFRGSWYTMR
jgi:hypothetical protein